MTGGRVNKCFFGVLGGFLPQLSADCYKWGLIGKPSEVIFHPFWRTQPHSPIYIIIIKCFFGVLGGFLPQLGPHLLQSAESCGRKPPKTPKKVLLTKLQSIRYALF